VTGCSGHVEGITIINQLRVLSIEPGGPCGIALGGVSRKISAAMMNRFQ
jgi:hypothetical protein